MARTGKPLAVTAEEFAKQVLIRKRRERVAKVAARHSSPPPKYRKKRTRDRVSDEERMNAARAVVREAMASEEGTSAFEKLDPFSFVALFVEAHARVYGVEPLELTQGNKAGAAVQMVTRLLPVPPFSNSGAELANYIRWVFVREERRMKKGLARVTERRVSWSVLFQPSWLLTDYVAAMGPR